MAQGPLSGLRIIEFAGIGPTPFCGMLLSDLGADVVRIDRVNTDHDANPTDILSRGRRSIALDLKTPEAVHVCRKLFERADAVIEGFRPGVMERLGLGPDMALASNPRLVYGRMTGWGQTGPLSHAAGHDINYLSLVGVTHAIGTQDRPVPPLNIVGDFGGGALYLAMGVLAGILHARESGRGQVVDTAIIDGAASLMAMFYGMKSAGTWLDQRQSNGLDGGAHFYNVYQCADGKWVSLGPIEPDFYALLREKIGLADPKFDQHKSRQDWPELQDKLAELIATRSQADWCSLLEGTDACFAPVLSLEDAPQHPHNRFRNTFVESDGVLQPAPAPRFSNTPGAIQRPPAKPGTHTDEVLRQWGIIDSTECQATADSFSGKVT
jgi:alpha-methylacyl-CoA racemase